MDLHGSFHVYDTTLRDGAQQEGLNLSVADKLTIARQLDGLGRGLHRGRLAGRQPQGHRVLPPRRGRARPAARQARGVRRHPPGGRRGRRRPAGRGAARQRRAGGHAGREVARPARRARAAHHARGEPRDGARHRQPPARPRGSRCSSTPSTSSTATAPTATTRSRCCARRTRPAPRSSRSATPTAACSRTGSPTWSTTSSRRPGSGSASTPTTTPAARSPTRWPRSTPARRTCRAASTATASAPATPTWSPWSPTSSSSWTGRCCPPGLLRRRHPDRARGRRGHQLPAGLAAAVRRRLGVRAQGRPARERDQGRPGPLPAHRARAGRQRHAAAGLRHGRPRLDRAQGPRARLRPRPRTGSWSPR